MIKIEILESEGLFKLREVEDYKFIIGEYATYNNYYQIMIQHKGIELKIGLQCINVGIKPQVEIYNDKLLIGAGDKFYVYEFQGTLIQEYSVFAFYEFIIKEHKILIISELDVFLLDSNFNKIWYKSFNEIIDLEEMQDNTIVLRDYENRIIKLDFATGSDMKNSL